ncbi:MAG: A24 family peptidase [Coriobacteriaceae bacterium]|nr:A24 family peptidase [Coriobacteriaceae bacterium]
MPVLFSDSPALAVVLLVCVAVLGALVGILVHRLTPLFAPAPDEDDDADPATEAPSLRLPFLVCVAIGALIYMSCLARFGLSWATLDYLILFSLLFMAASVDLTYLILPNRLLVPMALCWLVFALAAADPLYYLIAGISGALVLGIGVLLVGLILGAILHQDSIGGGDIKLFAVLGLFTGISQGLLLLICSCVIGLIFALVLRALRRPFPFGPAIAIAAWIVLMFGSLFPGFSGAIIV